MKYKNYNKIIIIGIVFGCIIYIFFLFKIYLFHSNYDFDYSDNSLICTDFKDCYDKSNKSRKDWDNYKAYIYLYKSLSFNEDEKNKLIDKIYGDLAHYRNDLYDIDGALYYYLKMNKKAYSCKDLKALTYLYCEKENYVNGLDLLSNYNNLVNECGLFYLKGVLYLGNKDYENAYNSFEKSLNNTDLYTNIPCSKYLLEKVINGIKIKINNPKSMIKFDVSENDVYCERNSENDNNGPNTYKPLYKDHIFLQFISNLNNSY